MRAQLVAIVIGLLVVGCGSPAATGSTAASAVASPSEASMARTSVASAAASTAASAAPSAPPSGGAFTVCPTAAEGLTCPLPPGAYTANVHDAFHFKIEEAGWQEERQRYGEFDTRILLSRTDEPSQRLTFLSGRTGVASPAVLDAAAFAVAGFKAGQPTDVMIAGTRAQSIELEPAGATADASLTLDDQTITLEPDRRYRITLSKIPMMEEAATVFIVVEAPVDRFAAFIPKADKVVQAVGF